MDDAAKEGAGGDDDGSAGESAAVGELDPPNGAGLGHDSGRFPFDKREVRRVREELLHRAPIEFPVGLSARALDRGALAAVENAKLDAREVGGARHHPVKRVNLAHQVAFAEAADGRVAGHLA